MEKSKKERVRFLRLWQFKVVNRHNLMPLPLILTVGFTLEAARQSLYNRFDPAVWEIQDSMAIDNVDFLAMCAAVYPDINDYAHYHGK